MKKYLGNEINVGGIIIKIILGFNIFTIILYLFPPIIKQHHNEVLVIIYLTSSILLIFLGFKFGRLHASNKMISPKKWFFYWSEKKMNILLFIYIITFLLKYSYNMGLSPFDINGMVSRLLIGIAEPNIGYALARNRGISPVPWSVYFIISVLIQFFFIIGFCAWRNLRYYQKVILIIFVLLELFFWMGTATAFGIICIITNILIVFLMIQKKRNSKRNIIVITFLFSIAIVFFSYNIIGRTGKGSADTALSTIEMQNSLNKEQSILKYLPESTWSTYYYIYSYTCQGYEHLGLAMNLEPTWTYFVGNNPHLMSLSNFLTGYDPMEDSYMKKLETNYRIDSYMVWHSQYLWWANDFSIIGALIVVFFISYFGAYSLYLYLKTGDFLSQVVSVVFLNLLLFLFANTTYLTYHFYSFMLIFPFWLFTRVIITKRIS